MVQIDQETRGEDTQNWDEARSSPEKNMFRGFARRHSPLQSDLRCPSLRKTLTFQTTPALDQSTPSSIAPSVHSVKDVSLPFVGTSHVIVLAAVTSCSRSSTRVSRLPSGPCDPQSPPSCQLTSSLKSVSSLANCPSFEASTSCAASPAPAWITRVTTTGYTHSSLQ